MDRFEQVCDHLKTISRLVSSMDPIDNNVLQQIEQQISVLSENDHKFEDVYRMIGPNVSQLVVSETLEDDSRSWIRLLDALIRCIVLLNHLEPSELISSQNFFAIKLNVIKLVSLTIIPYISDHFQQIQHLFLTVDIKSINISGKPIIHWQLVHKLTNLLLSFINSKSIISQVVIEDCFAPLMASLMTIKYNNESDEVKRIIDQEMTELVTNTDQKVVIRNLLLLSRCKASKWANNEISRYLSMCLIKDNGLLNLINAVLDTDQTSERETTLNQRFQAIGTIVAAIPQLCCSSKLYYERISEQLISLLMDSDPNNPKIASMILQKLESRNSKLTKEMIIDKILNAFQGLRSHNSLDINNSIEIIHNLIVNRYDTKKFISIVSHLFYCRVVLEESLSHQKTLLNTIIIEILQSTKNSVYLLDNTLFNNHRLINSYQICVKDMIGLECKQYSDTSYQSSSDAIDDQELSLKQVDSIVQFVLFLLDKMNDNFKIDLFLILIERMTFSRPSLLTCSLVDSIHENVSQILINQTEKSIRFVINTFQRMAEQSRQSLTNDSEIEEDVSEDQMMVEMRQNSLQMSLQIIKVILKEKQKLKPTDIEELRQLSPVLHTFSLNNCFDESLGKIAKELKNEIDLYETSVQFCKSNSSPNEFESAMTELNDPLMPVRAHALIRLKQLIYCKDKHLLDNKSSVINALKSCLNDSESYIYLSAVNTLSTLAIVATDQVLPILMQQFVDNERTVEERLKVGEVIVRLSKSIGDFGHHYSKQYMSCFLSGVKSSEAAIRISSLSNLGQFCTNLRFALKPFIVELLSCVEAVLKTDENLEVKRSSVMFLYLLLKGIDRTAIEAVDQHLRDIYRLLRHIYDTTIDDVLQLHTQLAIEEIDRIVKQLFTSDNQLIKNIKILSL